MGVYNLNFNRLKYIFGVQTDNFTRVLVHQFGTEVDKNKVTTIMQHNLCKINFLQRCMINTIENIRSSTLLLERNDTSFYKIKNKEH